MEDKTKAPRINLSNCKLLSVYGEDIAKTNASTVKVGGIIKPGLNKIGVIVKIGFARKPPKTF